MPASGIDCYIHDARNNFDAVRPAPVPTDMNVSIGQCHSSVHISTNCYYGYHNQKITNHLNLNTDCEMLEVPVNNGGASSPTTGTKRSADNADFPQSKRLRQEVQKEKTIEPETKETMKSETTTEDLLLETLYWNIHGGNVFHLIQCL